MNGEQFFALLTPVVGAEVTTEYRAAAQIDVAVNTAERTMTVAAAFSGEPKPGFDASVLEDKLRQALRLNRVTCTVTFTPAAEPAVEAAPVDPTTVPVELKRVAAELKARVPLVNGFMSGARLEMQPDSCRFFVSKAGLAILKPLGVEQELAAVLRDLYGLNVPVKLEADEEQAEPDLREMQRQVDEAKAMADEPKIEKKLEQSFPDLPICVKYAKMLYGERLPAKHPTPIAELSQELGSALVWGDVFALDVRTTRDNRNRIITFNLYDGSSSYSAKIFGPNENTEYLAQKLKDGMTVLLRGNVVYDKYARENVLDVKALAAIDKLTKTDDAPEKRVELHLHTRMSAMDGMTDVKDLVKRAVQWGHKAIAITDHGVVQAFPDAVKAAKGSDIKLLFGMEGYLVNDVDGDGAGEDPKKLPSYHVILLAKNNVGLKNLYKLITKSNLDYFYKRPRIPKSELAALREGIIIGSACEAGEVFRTMLNGSEEELLHIASFYDYIEIQPTGNNRFLLRADEYPQIQTNADLENLLNESAIYAAKDKRRFIRQADIERAFIKVGIGAEKKSKVISEKEKKITAYHEAGHAILFHVLPDMGPVHTISIIPTGMGAAGYTMPLPEKDEMFNTKGKMLQNIMVAFGGRIAEEIVFQDVTTGASQDIKQATAIARAMVTKYGMSEKAGMIHYGSDEDEVFIGRDFAQTRSYSESVAAIIDDEVKKIVDECYAKAKEIILKNEPILHKCCDLLLEKEKIGQEEFEALFEQE